MSDIKIEDFQEKTDFDKKQVSPETEEKNDEDSMSTESAQTEAQSDTVLPSPENKRKAVLHLIIKYISGRSFFDDPGNWMRQFFLVMYYFLLFVGFVGGIVTGIVLAAVDDAVELWISAAALFWPLVWPLIAAMLFGPLYLLAELTHNSTVLKQRIRAENENKIENEIENENENEKTGLNRFPAIYSEAAEKIKLMRNKQSNGQKKLIKKWWFWLIIAIVIVFVIILIIGASSNSTSNSGSSYSGNYGSSYDSSDSEISKSTAEYRAQQALYKKLREEYGSSYSIDVDSTRYSIGTVEKDGSGWKVRGTYTLYDKYGKLAEYSKKFTVNVESYGDYCYLDS